MPHSGRWLCSFFNKNSYFLSELAILNLSSIFLKPKRSYWQWAKLSMLDRESSHLQKRSSVNCFSYFGDISISKGDQALNWGKLERPKFLVIDFQPFFLNLSFKDSLQTLQCNGFYCLEAVCYLSVLHLCLMTFQPPIIFLIPEFFTSLQSSLYFFCWEIAEALV